MFRRRPVVRQSGERDCGPAALATIALYYRRPAGLERLRELAGADRAGTSLLGLLRAAERLGFTAKGVKGSYEALTRAPLPAVAQVTTEQGLHHFVVVYQAGRRVVVADPARGLESLSREQFCGRWTGRLLLLLPDPTPAGPARTGAPAGPARRFLGLLRAHLPVLAEAFGCALFLTLLGLASAFFIQHLVDSVLVRRDASLLNALGVGMALVLIFRVLFGLLQQYLLAHVGRQVDLALIARYARHVLGLPLRFFETRRVGEILSRVNDAAKVREAVSGATLTAVVDATLVVVLLAVLWLCDWPLAAVVTAFTPPLLIGVMAHHPATARRSRDGMECAAMLSAHLVEDVSGVETIKAFGREDDRAAEGESRLVRLVQSVFALQKIGLGVSALGTAVTGAAGLAVLWYGGHRVMSGALTIGQLMFFYSLLGHLLGPLERLAQVNVKLQEALAAVDRLYQILEVEPEEVAGPPRVKFAGLRRGIELENVTFGYGSRTPVLRGLNLRIPAGKTVAVVGESGSGKSTLLKLLMGYYAPDGGRLLLDGVDRRDYELASVRGRIGLVSQDPFIFTGTVRENIALGAPDATPEELIAATRAAGLESFIGALPERFETTIGERGANLSGGQRQRLAIARALVRNPDVLIFDEATSHLDTATERAIQESLKGALAGRTAVLVAHRLSTVKDADLIYVLDQGRVVEQGGHRELLEQGGRYAALWRAQTGDGEDEWWRSLRGPCMFAVLESEPAPG